MEKHNISVLISEEEVQKRVRELAAQISKDYEGESVKLICILKGSVFFTCELAKRITVPVILDFMQVSSYGSQTVSSGTLKVKKELDEPIEGDNVITPSKKALELFYNTEVDRVFKSEVEIAKKCFTNLPEFTLKYRNMLTRWGVCNPSKKTVTLNTELLKKDINLLDYVIIHELCHFFEPNHSKKFWNLVGLAYPDYKNARKALKS